MKKKYYFVLTTDLFFKKRPEDRHRTSKHMSDVFVILAKKLGEESIYVVTKQIEKPDLMVESVVFIDLNEEGTKKVAFDVTEHYEEYNNSLTECSVFFKICLSKYVGTARTREEEVKIDFANWLFETNWTVVKQV